MQADTKWPLFWRRHFQAHFLARKHSYFDSNVTEVYFFNLGSNVNVSTFILGNGLALNMGQAIAWTDDDPIHRDVYMYIGH